MGVSLSARRAWIEIYLDTVSALAPKQSLSARRAWIEISFDDGRRIDFRCRSPQGERG